VTDGADRIDITASIRCCELNHVAAGAVFV